MCEVVIALCLSGVLSYSWFRVIDQSRRAPIWYLSGYFLGGLIACVVTPLLFSHLPISTTIALTVGGLLGGAIYYLQGSRYVRR